jgi:hypothetical protein
MSVADTKKTLELLEKYKAHPKLKVVHRPLPWDAAIELVDVFVAGDESEVRRHYLEDRCNLCSSSPPHQRASRQRVAAGLRR